MEKNIKIAAINTIKTSLTQIKGNVELVKESSDLTETKDIMASLILAEKLASRLLERFEKKALKVEAKPMKVKKEKKGEKETVISEPFEDLSVEHLAQV